MIFDNILEKILDGIVIFVRLSAVIADIFSTFKLLFDVNSATAKISIRDL